MVWSDKDLRGFQRIVVSILFLTAVLAWTTLAQAQVVYTAVNIHTQKSRDYLKASYANYTNPGKGHVVVPVNTPIVIEDWRKGFAFTVQNEGTKCYFEFHEGRMQMSVEEYIPKITSPTPINLDQFSEVDRQGIKEARAISGMSKKAVMIALGYPAAHRTPSLEANTWTYWTNRFRTVAVQFDMSGKVVQGTPAASVAYVKVVKSSSKPLGPSPTTGEPTYENVKIIDVLIKGIDDGVKSTKRKDRDEAMLDAKLQAMERAGVKIESLTQVENFTLKKDLVEQKSKAVLMPGFQIVDSGYQRDGTYLIILSGKIKLIEQKLTP